MSFSDWLEGDEHPEVKYNGLKDGGGQAFQFAHNDENDSGLQVAITGGNISETIAATDTNVTCTDNDDTYIVVHRTTGAITGAITTTNWNSTTYGRIGIATFASGVLTVFKDLRESSGGIYDQAGSFDIAGTIHGATGKTTPVDADELAIADSAASFALKKLTWANLKATLKTYFDTLYAVVGAITGSGLTMTTARLLGRTTASTGAIEEITIGSGLSLSAGSLNATGLGGTITALTGDVTASGSGSVAATIASDAVTNAKLANVSTQTIKGRTTSGTGDPEDLTSAQAAAVIQGDGLTVDLAGFRGIPQNSQSAAYTLVAADAGKHIYHPSGDANARTFTIPANGSVAFPVGTSVTFINETSQVVTIAITTDTMVLSVTGSTGSRTLAQYGVATAVKVTSTRWYISGTGIT